MSEDAVRKKSEIILKSLSEEERVLLAKIIQCEKERIHMKIPYGINDELRRAIEEVIR